MNKKLIVISILGILFLAGVLRMYHLEFQSLWIDEISTMNGSDPELSVAQVIQYSQGDQPPLYFLLLHEWVTVFPFNDFSGRILSVIFGLAGVIAMYFLGREFNGVQTGLIAALLTSLNYIHIFFSQEIRFYGLLFLLSALSCLFFWRALKAKTTGAFAGYTCMTVLLVYTHYFGLIMLASQGILFLVWVWLYDRSRRFLLMAMGSGMIVALSTLPWISALLTDKRGASFWLAQEPFYFPFKYFYVYFKDYASALVFGFIMLWFGIRTFLKFKSREDVRAEIVLIGLVFLGYLLPYAYSLIKIPMLHVRYTLIVLPALLVMISMGIGYLHRSWQKVILISTSLTAVLSLIFVEKYYTKPFKEDWRGIATSVINDARDQDVLIAKHAWYCNYYFKTLRSRHLVILPEQFHPESMPDRVWWLDGFSLNPEPDLLERRLLRDGYRLVKTDSAFNARATLYEKAR